MIYYKNRRPIRQIPIVIMASGMVGQCVHFLKRIGTNRR